MDIHALVFTVFAVIVAMAVLPLVIFMLYLVKGGVLEGVWVGRALYCVLWSLTTMGAVLVSLPDSIVLIFGVMPSLVLVAVAWQPLFEGWRNARETDKDAAWRRHVREQRQNCLQEHPSNQRQKVLVG